ncbi:hypothetical protein LXL04_003788 [Taraxacum kok-saghyz]
MLPPCRRKFKDIYVVFELMESDLDEVIKVNDDLTPEHHQFFLYQLLRALKYIHTARASFDDTPSAIFWTDYVDTRWYCATELCGSFFSKYTSAIDIWSIGSIFAEMLTGKPLNVVHQLDLVIDLLSSPPPEIIARIRNDKARRYLNGLPNKVKVPLSNKFPNADPLALRLLEKLLAFDPADRISAEEISFTDPCFYGLADLETEPSKQPISKLEFDFEKRKLTKNDVRELIYREGIFVFSSTQILMYPRSEFELFIYLFMELFAYYKMTKIPFYPTSVELIDLRSNLRILKSRRAKEEETFHLEGNTRHCQERICVPIEEAVDEMNEFERRTNAAIATTLRSPPRSSEATGVAVTPVKFRCYKSTIL